MVIKANISSLIFCLYKWWHKHFFLIHISDAQIDGITDAIDELQLAAKYRSSVASLASHPDSRDVHLNQLTITFHGAELLVDADVEFNCGRRYGLIGLNGCGKQGDQICLICFEL